MHQGVIAFIFRLAKVFINVLRKRHKEYFTYAVWTMELTVSNWFITLSDQHHVELSMSKRTLNSFHFLFVISVCQIYLDLSNGLIGLSLSFWWISCLERRGKTVENHSTISLPLVILSQPGYRKKSQMCTSSSTLTIHFLSIKTERFSTAVKDDAC